MSQDKPCEDCKDCTCRDTIEVPRAFLEMILVGALHESCGCDEDDPAPTWGPSEWAGVAKGLTLALSEAEIVTGVNNETGEEEDFAVIATFELNGNRYAVLASADDTEGGDADILRIEIDPQDGGEQFVSIADDDEWQAALDEFGRLAQEQSSADTPKH